MGNGSNELIDLLIRVFCEPGDRIIVPARSFMAYPICAQAARVGVLEIPLKSEKSLTWDVEGFLKNWKTSSRGREKILFLPHPNNPTGTHFSNPEIKFLLDELGGREDLLLVFDEAYHEYVREPDWISGMNHVQDTPNLLVLRTFSKIFGLAGLRVGALVGDPKHLQWVHRIRNPFNVNSLAQEVAQKALEDKNHTLKSQRVVWEGLDNFYSFFEDKGIPYWLSQGNFILFDSLREGQAYFENTMSKGLLIRPMGSYGMIRHIRITMGLPGENERAKEILSKSFQEVSPL